MLRKLLVSKILFFLLIASTQILAQTQQLYTSQQFRLGERIIRIAEPGQLADSINVWGDVGSAGLYIVPKGTNLIKIISYGFGPRTLRDGQTELDWSKMRVEVNVQKFDEKNEMQTIKKFRYRFEEAFPDGMSNFIVENNQTITIRVKRKPSLRDYISVIAPVISAIGTAVTAFVLLENRN